MAEDWIAVDWPRFQLKSVARLSSDTVVGLAYGPTMAVSSVSAYCITLRLPRTSFKILTRHTSAQLQLFHAWKRTSAEQSSL